jgi:RNA polymerase sigma-70 factor (ECF subfamily)
MVVGGTMPGPSSARSLPLGTDDDATAEAAGLVARAKRDPQAFALLYRRFVGPVYEFCAFRLGSIDAAEDATSRTFERALASLGQCRDESFRGWLFTIAAHVVADHLRGAGRHRPLDAARDHPDRGPTPEEAAIAGDDARRLAALLGRLPADQRRVLELRLTGLTGAEIAAAMGRSHEAVRMLQVRAIKRLRALLADGDPDRRPHDG